MNEPSRIEEILLVTIWRLKGEAYGVKIRRHVSRVLGKDITYGHLYSALHQLTAKTYVTQVAGDSAPGRRGRRRIYYAVTPAGFKALRSAREITEKLWAGLPALAAARDEDRPPSGPPASRRPC